jgi:tetratricopeptide (TPR) repeat protein
MSGLTLDILKAALRLTLVSASSEPFAQVDALTDFARTCGDRVARTAALAQAIDLLQATPPDPTSDADTVALRAQRVGRTAERLKLPALARRSYTLAARLTTEDYQLAVTWADIGDTFASEAEYDEAIAGYRTAVQYAAATRDTRTQVSLLQRIATIESERGRLAEALADLERALVIGDGARRQDELNTADTLLMLGALKQKLGELHAAKGDVERACASLARVPDPDADRLAAGLTALGSINRDLGDLDAARADFTRALEVGIDARGDTDAGLTESLVSLGRLLAASGRPEPAKEYFEWALAASHAADTTTTSFASDLVAALAGVEPARIAKSGPEHVLESPAAILDDQRRWVFELRRRALEDEDVRAALEPCLVSVLANLVSRHRSEEGPDLPGLAEALKAIYPARVSLEEVSRKHLDVAATAERIREDLQFAWDERERDLGLELVRALERYLLVQVIDETWPKHRDAGARQVRELASQSDADYAALARHLDRELAAALWEPFLTLLFHAEVQIEEDEQPAADESAYVKYANASATRPQIPLFRLSGRRRAA